MSELPWCPWCFYDAVKRGDNVECLVTRVSGQQVIAWDQGGFGCSSCGTSMPRTVWAKAMAWVAAAAGFDQSEYQPDVDKCFK